MTALQIVDQWLHVPTLKLKAGEMSAQELRTVKAVLKGLRADLVAQMEANPTAQDVSMRYEALNEARQLVLDEALGWCEQRRGDADGRISQALSDAAESIGKRMTKPAAPAAEATTIGPADSEPPLRLPNEKTNFAWVRWYQFKEGCNLQNAVAAYNKRIKALRASASQGNLPAAVPGVDLRRLGLVMQKSVTRLPYRYTDHAGRTVHGVVYVSAKLEDIRHIEPIQAKLDAGDGFIAADLGLGIAELQTRLPMFPSEHDHVFHVFDFDQRTYSRQAPAGAHVIDVDEFLGAFGKIADSKGWDVVGAATRLKILDHF